MPGFGRKDPPAELRALLGTVSDRTIAERAHVDVKTARRWREADGKRPAGRHPPKKSNLESLPPPSRKPVHEMTRVEFLELQLEELRAAQIESTGVAVAQLKRQEREVWDELEEARKVEALAVEQMKKRKAPPDAILRQVIIPRALKMSRPHREALYLALGQSLGVDQEPETKVA